MTVKFKLAFSIFLTWLFNISGIFGILSEESGGFGDDSSKSIFISSLYHLEFKGL